MARGRKLNNSVDVLKECVKRFAEHKLSKNILTDIQGTELAEFSNEFCKDILKKPVRDYHFMKNKKVRPLIDDYNNHIDERIIGMGVGSMIDEDYMVDISSVGNEAISKANAYIEFLSTTNRKITNELEKIKKENEVLLGENTLLKNDNDQYKKQIAAKNNELRNLRSINDKIIKYCENVVFDPVIHQHFFDIGLLKWKNGVRIPENCKHMTETEGCDTLDNTVKEFETMYADNDDPDDSNAGLPIIDDKHTEATNNLETGKVLSKTEMEVLLKYGNLS